MAREADELEIADARSRLQAAGALWAARARGLLTR